MTAMNLAVLMGNLTREPELKETGAGVPVCDFRIGVSEVFTNRNGEKTEQALFIDVEAWDKVAGACARCLSKGSQVLVEGRLKLSEWTTEDGQKRSKVFVRANRVQFVGRPRGQEEEAAAPAAAGAGEAIPF